MPRLCILTTWRWQCWSWGRNVWGSVKILRWLDVMFRSARGRQRATTLQALTLDSQSLSQYTRWVTWECVRDWPDEFYRSVPLINTYWDGNISHHSCLETYELTGFLRVLKSLKLLFHKLRPSKFVHQRRVSLIHKVTLKVACTAKPVSLLIKRIVLSSLALICFWFIHKHFIF